MRRPERPLTCEIGQLSEGWLLVTCPNGHSVAYPLKLMARRHDPRLSIWTVARRLRCKACRKRPQKLLLTETPYNDYDGMAKAGKGWEIDVLGELAGPQ